MKKFLIVLLVGLTLTFFPTVSAFAQTLTSQEDIMVTDENGGTYTIISEEIQESRTRVKGDKLYYEVRVTFDPGDDPRARPSNNYPFGEIVIERNNEVYRGYIYLDRYSRDPSNGRCVCFYAGYLTSTGMY